MAAGCAWPPPQVQDAAAGAGGGGEVGSRQQVDRQGAPYPLPLVHATRLAGLCWHASRAAAAAGTADALVVEVCEGCSLAGTAARCRPYRRCHMGFTAPTVAPLSWHTHLRLAAPACRCMCGPWRPAGAWWAAPPPPTRRPAASWAWETRAATATTLGSAPPAAAAAAARGPWAASAASTSFTSTSAAWTPLSTRWRRRRRRWACPPTGAGLGWGRHGRGQQWEQPHRRRRGCALHGVARGLHAELLSRPAVPLLVVGKALLAHGSLTPFSSLPACLPAPLLLQARAHCVHKRGQLAAGAVAPAANHPAHRRVSERAHGAGGWPLGRGACDAHCGCALHRVWSCVPAVLC